MSLIKRPFLLNQLSKKNGCVQLNIAPRIIDIVYNACNNELVRTKTIVKNAIVVIDAAPFRQWYEAHYALPLGHKKGTKLSEAEEALINKKRSKKTEKKYKERQKEGKVSGSRAFHFSFGLLADMQVVAICLVVLCSRVT